ncbi:hypothetical protein ACWDV7_39105 [Streptomyces sp. NPDC003362]
MSGSPSPSGAHDDEDHRAPRWVRISVGIAGLLVVVFVVVHLAGGGMVGHTP